MGLFGKKESDYTQQIKAEKARRLAEKKRQAREDKRKRELELLRKRTELFQARSKERRSLEELRKSRRAAIKAIVGGRLIPKPRKKHRKSGGVRLF